ncbi:hypothetical protein ACSX1A_19330 [Pontibacter sp. MBLB2868]|uniref:hypothetical protein n=1 Tax=Pontibacter sp. MBLB2868 TaxID=3451555 RepID=UPI003F756CA0
MKKTTYVVAMGFFALTTLAGCFKNEEPAPALDSVGLKASVQGKWFINRISYRLCRENNCNTTYYAGTAQDYFEFKADSAYLVQRDEQDVRQKTSFAADYSRRDAIILTTTNWSGTFIVEELRTDRVVLRNEFKGRDPAAVFTDTYELTR